MDAQTGYSQRGRQSLPTPPGKIRVPYMGGYRDGHDAIVDEIEPPAVLKIDGTASGWEFTYALARTAAPIEDYDHCLAYVQVQSSFADDRERRYGSEVGARESSSR